MGGNKAQKDYSTYISLVGLLFLVFIMGVAMGTYGYYPAPLIQNAGKALKAVLHPSFSTDNIQYTNFYAPEKPYVKDKAGVTVFDRARAFPGHTLYTSGHEQAAYLIDMEGHVKYKWHVPMEAYWQWGDDKVFKYGRYTQKDHDKIYVGWRAAHVYPNGDLLVVVIAWKTPWGVALLRINKDSKLIWIYPGGTHHDLFVDDDGKIYTLTHRIIQEAPKGLEFLEMPVTVDYLSVLDSQGKFLYQVSLLEAIRDSKYKDALLRMKHKEDGDILHTNSVDVIGPKFASRVPFAKAGQIGLFFREKNTLAIFDPKQKKIVWAKMGLGKGAHDPDYLDNGNILLFDNKGLGEGKSRVIEMESKNFNIVRSIEGTPDKPMFSDIRGRQQLLPNGNILITESDTGRLLEVAEDGEIVWEYINPVRSKKNGKTFIPVLMSANRHGMGDLKFLEN